MEGHRGFHSCEIQNIGTGVMERLHLLLLMCPVIICMSLVHRHLLLL